MLSSSSMRAAAGSVTRNSTYAVTPTSIRLELRNSSLIEVGVTAYVEFLVTDPAAARILLLESIGTSPEVNAYRSHIRREVSRVVREIWAEYDPVAAASPHAS